MDRILRGIAGSFILLSLLLAVYVSPLWLWFTAFAGVSLLQSAFTNWCPMMWLLGKLGVKQGLAPVINYLAGNVPVEFRDIQAYPPVLSGSAVL